MPKNVSNRGFSLVELSIVLVILGLLTGGILAGQSLIRASELRSINAQYSQYSIAVQSFRDRYMAIPGDMNIATRFWGKDDANCTGDTGTAATPGTCNGDGDGRVESTASAANTTGENYQFWKQLALAGLVEGSYTGLAGAGGTNHSVIGSNVPASKMSNVGWSVFYIGPSYGGDTARFAMDYLNIWELGSSITNSLTAGAFLKPEEAWNIDTKFDDGKPSYGKVIGRYWNNACSVADDGGSAQTDLVASYKLTETSQTCSLIFRQLF